MDTGVSVVGSGQVEAPADVLVISLAVEHVATDVAVAVAHVAERTESVRAALRAQNLDSSAIHTAEVTVYQEYRERETSPAYRAAHLLTVTTKDLTGFGGLLNAAVDAAGNSLGVHSLRFDIEDKAPLLTRARELAFRQAREKAEELAALAGYSLGAVTSVSENVGYAPMPEHALGAKAAFDSQIHVTPGDQSINVSLEVHFSWA